MPRYIEELVSQQVRRSELAHLRRVEEGSVCPRPVVTISRRMGSGARIIAQRVAHDLGWSLWDKEILNAMAQEAHVSRQVVELFDEKTMSDIESVVRGALGNKSVGGFIYEIHLARAVASIAKLGNAIILGRGANFILPDALHIRIDASDERRISNMASYENMSRGEAETKIHGSDKARAQFLISTYGRERVQSAHYDLNIWMDRFSIDGAVELVEEAIRIWCKSQPQTDE